MRRSRPKPIRWTPTTKYFLNRFIDDYYSREAGHGRASLAPQSPLSDHRASQRSLPGRRPEYRHAGSGEPATRSYRSSGLSCGFKPTNRTHGATADFDLVRLVNAVESERERWSLSLQFIFLEAVPTELMIFNPMGIIVTYLRGDRAMVSAGRNDRASTRTRKGPCGRSA